LIIPAEKSQDLLKILNMRPKQKTNNLDNPTKIPRVINEGETSITVVTLHDEPPEIVRLRPLKSFKAREKLINAQQIPFLLSLESANIYNKSRENEAQKERSLKNGYMILDGRDAEI